MNDRSGPTGMLKWLKTDLVVSMAPMIGDADFAPAFRARSSRNQSAKLTVSALELHRPTNFEKELIV